MKIVLALILLVPAIASAEKISFIGSPLKIERSEKSCMEYLPEETDKQGRKAVCMDRAFLMTYEVLESLTIDWDESSVDFVGFYHYWGMPSYATYEPALVVLERVEGNLLLKRIDPVEDTDDGWWVCEEWPEDESTDCSVGQYASEIVREDT
ncbi:MAG: hypothetical protein ACFHX7_20780 [Pseudomonadota bacterium]